MASRVALPVGLLPGRFVVYGDIGGGGLRGSAGESGVAFSMRAQVR